MKSSRWTVGAILLGLYLPVFAQTGQKPPEQPPAGQQSPEQKPQPEKPPVVVKIPQKEADKQKIHDESPAYPAEAKRKGMQGDVVMEILIDTAGKISGAKVVKGDPVLVASVAQAMKQWRYKPYLLNGEPVQVETTVTVHFWIHTSRF